MLVIDDHDLVRLGLRTLIQSHAASNGQHVRIFEARTLQEALAIYQEHQAHIDLVLLDLHLPDAHGVSGLATFIGRFPDARVIVISGVNDPSLVQETTACGAMAYLSKSADLPNLVDFIGSKGIFMKSPPTHGGSEALSAVRSVRTLGGNSIALSARQAQAFDFLLSGQSNKEIAEKMHLSEGTVKNHISTLLLLFGVRSRAQLISQLR
jgi:DNA-binding NarL/FixJ family response regulator